MKRLFIVNCWSGRGLGSKYAKLIEEWYEKRGIKPIILSTTEDGPNAAFNLGKKAVQEGFEIIGAVGGDGTWHLVSNGMIASGVPLEQLPALGLVQAGVGNNFAKNLGTPENPIKALEVIENGQVITVDLGRLILRNEEKYFLNVVSFGFDALVAELAKNLKAKYRFSPKESNYLLSVLAEIIKGMEFYEIGVNGQKPKEMILVAVSNGPTYGAILKIAPGADLQDGLLDVCCIRSVDNIKVLKDIIVRVIRGTHLDMPEVAMLRISSLTISSPENLPCEIDGEVLTPEKEYQIEVLPRRLKVLVPPSLLAGQRPLIVKKVKALGDF